MSKPHIITISGKPGSGKSSTAREVAKLLKYEHYSAGTMVRRIAKENGLTLEECNRQALTNTAMDRRVDHYLKQLGSRNNIVIDSRLGFYWIPKSFKVYLELDSEIAVARVYRDIENTERRGERKETFEEIWEQIETRTRNERARFKKLYNVNPFSTRNYDLVIRTERNNPMTAALWVHDRYQEWLEKDQWRQVVEKVPLGYSEK